MLLEQLLFDKGKIAGEKGGGALTREKGLYSIQSVEDALSLLEALSDEEEEVRLGSLSERLNMNRGRVFRFLATFEQRGYIERVGTTSRYRLGISAFEMGVKFLQRMTLLRQAKPVMERLARQCDEAVYLSIPRGGESLFLEMCDTAQAVKIVSLVGRRYPLDGSAAGRALLYGRAAGGVKGGDFRQEVEIDHGALGEGISCIALPMVNGAGEVPGSLCLVGPDYRFQSERIARELSPLLRESAGIISSKLGCVG